MSVIGSWWQRLRHGTVRATPVNDGHKLTVSMDRHRFLRRTEHLGRTVYPIVNGAPQTVADGAEVLFYPDASVVIPPGPPSDCFDWIRP